MISHISTSYLPSWISDTEIDAQWLEQVVPELQNVAKCHVEDISNQGRRRESIKDGATLKLSISFADPSRQEVSVVIKQVPVADLDHSKMLGLSREALFYQRLAPRLLSAKILPKVYYSYGDMTSGAKLILMEDLSTDYVDSGILFGPGNPNNWTRNLPTLIAKAYSADQRPPTSQEVSQQTFLAIAKVHATFWKDESLLSHSYLGSRSEQGVVGGIARIHSRDLGPFTKNSTIGYCHPVGPSRLVLCHEGYGRYLLGCSVGAYSHSTWSLDPCAWRFLARECHGLVEGSWRRNNGEKNGSEVVGLGDGRDRERPSGLGSVYFEQYASFPTSTM
jgi:hypothetical protein